MFSFSPWNTVNIHSWIWANSHPYLFTIINVVQPYLFVVIAVVAVNIVNRIFGGKSVKKEKEHNRSYWGR